MSIAPQTIRQRISTALDGVAGWSPATVAHGTRPDVKRFGHKQYTVGVPGGVTRQGKHIVANGAYTETTVAVQWRYKLRPDAHVADYDAALVEEAKLIAAVYALSDRTGLPGLQVTRQDRRVESDGKHLLGDLAFAATHLLPLS